MLRWAVIFPNHRFGSRVVRIHWDCGRRRGDCEISVFPLPGHLPDLFHPSAVGRQKSNVVGRPPVKGSQSNMTA
jgi:hypothetical protein